MRTLLYILYIIYNALELRINCKHHRRIGKGMIQREKLSMKAKIARSARTTSVLLLQHAFLFSCRLAAAALHHLIDFTLQLQGSPVGKVGVHSSFGNAAVGRSFSSDAVDVISHDGVADGAAMYSELMTSTSHWCKR